MSVALTKQEWPALLPRILRILGFVCLLIGAIDPLEGSAIILPGAGIVTLEAFVGGSRHRKLLARSFLLVAAGVAAMLLLSAFGGIGGRTGHSLWWGLLVLPYPVGWMMTVIGAIRRVAESSERPIET